MDVGIIGAGRIGKTHAEVLRRHATGLHVRAVAVRQLHRELAGWARDAGVACLTNDYHDLLRDPRIGAVLICTPGDSHARLIEEAADAGKHVFCEKPVSLSPQRVVDAMRAADRAGVVLQVGFQRRFDRNFRLMHDRIVAGGLGDVRTLKLTSRNIAPPPLSYLPGSGGIFLDMMVHDIDMARYLACSEVREVYAHGDVLTDPAIREAGDYDTAAAMLKFENGATALIDNCRQCAYGHDQRAEAFGSRGCLTADNERASTVSLHLDGHAEYAAPVGPFLPRYEQAYAAQFAAFAAACAGDAPVQADGFDGLQALRIGLAARQSAAENRPVALPPLTRGTV